MHTVSRSNTWTQAIDYIAGQARIHWPDNLDRISRGAEMARDGSVIRNTDGTYSVWSANGVDAYRVNGKCECKDAQYRAPEGRCKHRIAVAIIKAAMQYLAREALAEGFAEMNPIG